MDSVGCWKFAAVPVSESWAAFAQTVRCVRMMYWISLDLAAYTEIEREGHIDGSEAVWERRHWAEHSCCNSLQRRLENLAVPMESAGTCSKNLVMVHFDIH